MPHTQSKILTQLKTHILCPSESCPRPTKRETNVKYVRSQTVSVVEMC